jgi:hypothetical protein
MDPTAGPGYSEEQYQPEFMIGYGAFSSAVKGHLAGQSQPKHISTEDWRRLLLQLKESFEARANSVYDGFNSCLAVNCAPGTRGWDEWSTPSRDGRLKSLLNGILRTVELERSNRQVTSMWNEFLGSEFLIDQNLKITYQQAIEVFNQDRFNSDPRVSILVRWGL